MLKTFPIHLLGMDDFCGFSFLGLLFRTDIVATK